jgi:hypothetical protein
MRAEDFRRLALALPEAEEKSHFGKADFRVKSKIFASMPDVSAGVVKLKPEQQEMMVAAEPKIFSALKGGWGDQGWTRVELAAADEITLQSALLTAWRNVAPKSMQRYLVGTGTSPR